MNILLVEDNTGDARLIRVFLSEAMDTDCCIVHAVHLGEAIERLRASRFDVILLDLSLPDSRGGETFRKIHACAPSTAVVVLSGLEDERLAISLVEAGAQDYLVKSDIDGRALARSMRYAVERKKAECAMRLAARVFETTLEGIVVTDAAGKMLSANGAFSRMSGYASDELAAATIWQLAAGRDETASLSAIKNALETSGEWQGELWMRRKEGEIFPTWASFSGVVQDFGINTHFVVALTEISALKRSEERLQYLAFHDPLTGLPNRVLFHDRLSQMISLARRDGSMFAVLFLDLDRFKLINDTLGHAAGDALLKEMAERLRACLREADTVGRLGGDEFAVILTNIQRPEDTDTITQKILDVLCEPFNLDGHELCITVSIGITYFPGEHQDATKLLEYADVAMYHAKESGGNNVQSYRAEMNAAAFERLKLETSPCRYTQLPSAASSRKD